LIFIISHVTVWCPQGTKPFCVTAFGGHMVKCLGLVAGDSFSKSYCTIILWPTSVGVAKVAVTFSVKEIYENIEIISVLFWLFCIGCKIL